MLVHLAFGLWEDGEHALWKGCCCSCSLSISWTLLDQRSGSWHCQGCRVLVSWLHAGKLLVNIGLIGRVEHRVRCHRVLHPRHHWQSLGVVDDTLLLLLWNRLFSWGLGVQWLHNSLSDLSDLYYKKSFKDDIFFISYVVKRHLVVQSYSQLAGRWLVRMSRKFGRTVSSSP